MMSANVTPMLCAHGKPIADDWVACLPCANEQLAQMRALVLALEGDIARMMRRVRERAPGRGPLIGNSIDPLDTCPTMK